MARRPSRSRITVQVSGKTKLWPMTLAGSYKLHAGFCAKLGLDPHAHGAQTTKDGQITVEFVECLAACGTAPVLLCNETLHENVSEAKSAEILGGCK